MAGDVPNDAEIWPAMPNPSWPRACLIEGIFDGDAGQHVAAISCGQLRTGSSASPRTSSPSGRSTVTSSRS